MEIFGGCLKDWAQDYHSRRTKAEVDQVETEMKERDKRIEKMMLRKRLLGKS